MAEIPDLFLMRHGETEWNAEGRMQGIDDSPLTARGRNQAARQAELLKDFGPEVGAGTRYSSTLGRARQTAEIIFDGGACHYDPRLVEIDVGAFTGMRVEDLQISHPEIFTGAPLDWYNRVPGGEHFSGLEARVREFLERLDGPAVIVTHGVTLRMIRVVAMGLTVSRIGEMPVWQGGLHVISKGAHRAYR